MADFNGIDITRKAVEAMRAAGADKAQASLSRSEQSELNVDAGTMSLYRTTVNLSMNLMAYTGGRKGQVALNKCDDASIQTAAKNALDMARSAEPDPANDISPAQRFESFRHGDSAPDNQAMYARLKEFLGYAAATYPITQLEQCILNFRYGQSFYANSNGAAFEERGGLYDFSAMFTSKKDGRASSFNYSGASHLGLGLALKDWGSIDMLMKQSAEQTIVSPIEGSFTGDILITPDCIADFLSYMDGVYLSDYPLITGVSPWKDSLGKSVVSPLISLYSEPVGSRIEAGYSYTGDGFKAENCAIIEKGRLKNFTLGLYGSNKSGKPRCPSGGGAQILEPGATAFADMLRDVKKGILLARFSGGNPAANGDFSGVAKNSYLIEDGLISRPVGETMVAGNVAALFNAVRAVSKESVNYGSAIMPWVLSGGVTISGK